MTLRRALLSTACVATLASACRTTSGEAELKAVPSPGGYRLVQPSAISPKDDGSFGVTFEAPCVDLDGAGFVGHGADGAPVVQVGIVYDTTRCVAGPARRIELVLMDDDASGRHLEAGGRYVPLRVEEFLAAPVTIEKDGNALVATFEVPCAEVDGEAFVKASDASGNHEVAVGAIFAKKDCRPGGPKALTRRITLDDMQYAYLGGGEGEVVFYVPMAITAGP